MPDELSPRLLSVITAVLPSRTQFLEAAWASLWQQDLPRGWSWEWLVQLDGPSDDLENSIEAMTSGDSRVRFESSAMQLGTSTTRNAALGRARGELVMNLDADDEYETGALHLLISALTEDLSLGWAAGRTVYLRTDGSTVPYPDRLPTGRIETGWFSDDWLAHDRPAAHPSAFIVRTSVLSAFGGWMALGGSEETGVLAAISEYWPGYGVHEPVLRYRKWPKQLTASPAWRAERSIHYRAIARRVTSIRALGEG